MRLAEPRALALLAVAAAVAIAGALAILRRRRLLAAWGPPARLAPGARIGPQALALALSCAGLAALAVAAARPEVPAPGGAALVRGLDLAIALDASRSMRARDVPPDRLSRARLEVSALLDRLPGDRVALVAFAAGAFVQAPLGLDRAATRLLLDAVDPAAMPAQGTALGPALDAARRALGRGTPGRDRAVLLVTDGEDHEPGAEESAARLADEGIALVVVGVGTPEGAPLAPSAPGAPAVVTRLAEPALRAVAARGRGTYLRAPASPAGLPEVAAALAGLARGEAAVRAAARWEDRSAPFAAAGLALLLAGALLPALRRPGTRGAAVAAAVAGLAASPFRVEHEGVRAANARLAADPAGALAAYEAAEREVGPRPELDLARGVALARLGRAEAARRAFELAARSAGPLGSMAFQDLAHLRLAAGDEEGALAGLREALRRDADNAGARNDLEVLLRRRNDRSVRPGRSAAEGGAESKDRERDRDQDRESPVRPERSDAEGGAESKDRDRAPAAATDGAMSRADAERLLDEVARAERPMPAPAAPRRAIGAKDW